VVDHLAECQFGEVWLVGAAFAATQHGAARVFADADAVKEELLRCPIEKRYILVKGSNSMKLSSLVPYL
jgi:UDP-N-acetylmuramyl pentapeptide synthase